MSTDVQKNELLEDFKQYLEQSNLEQLPNQGQPDLHTLLSELLGLKTEVKAESRQFKNTLETLSSALDTVQKDNKTMSIELALYQQRLEQQKADTTRSMLLGMVEVYDRLTIGECLLQNYRPSTKLFNKSRKKDVRFIERFKQGQGMTIRRFEDLLQQYQVQSIDCVNKKFDPLTMNAVETSENLKVENGIVVEELRKGFLFQDQVLRLADVKVNKIDLR